MRGTLLGLLAIGSLLGCAAVTDDETAADSSEIRGIALGTADLVGYYDPGQYLKNVHIHDWGGQPMLTADVPYSNLTFHDVDFLLTPANDTGTMAGSSSLRVTFGGNIPCSYPIDVVVLTTRDANGDVNLYIRDHRPDHIPGSLPGSATSCPPLNQVWDTSANPYVKRTPIKQFTDMTNDLCTAVKARVPSVTGAKRLTTIPTLPALPSNIFSASGDWESLSTPGRDTTLRGQVKAIYDFLQQNVVGTDAHSIATRLQTAWASSAATCGIAYPNSTGATTTITLKDFVERAYDISFDPYHCPELRWGADVGSPEYATCNTQDEAHVKRYTDEASLRNYVVRPPNGPTPLGSGPAHGAEIDFGALIDRLAQ